MELNYDFVDLSCELSQRRQTSDLQLWVAVWEVGQVAHVAHVAAEHCPSTATK